MDDIHIWAQWCHEAQNRIVKQEDVGEYWVSTVFLGIDHNFGNDGEGIPILFETMMTRRGEWCDYQDRYATWDEAVEGHDRIVLGILTGEIP